MNTPLTRSLGIISFLCTLLSMSAPWLRGQTEGKVGLPLVEGTVHDSKDRPIAGAVMTLENTDSGHTAVATTDSLGRFRFEAVAAGNYRLRAKREGYLEGRDGPFALHEREAKSITLLLADGQTAGTSKDAASTMEFSDEPSFAVAGVTDTTALGGHGSDRVLPSSNALARDAASLAREGNRPPKASPSQPEHAGSTSEPAIRAKLASEDNADLHAQLAEIEEAEGRSLEAVKDYQCAAEMDPSEPHLFSWGAELLLHHAPEPAIEVFIKGRRLYPQSTRMMLGLGAARYAAGSREQAGQIFLEACDRNPSDPTPYLFLGRLQATENVEPAGWTDRMKRFVILHAESAMAHYLYAVALTKQIRNQENSVAAESELETAIALDPHLGNAYLQLGILLSDREDFRDAIAALQKAVETTALPEEAHYRMAQVYRRMGEADKSSKEIQMFKQMSEQKKREAERERHEIQQFVYTLRSQNPPPQPPTPNPR